MTVEKKEIKTNQDAYDMVQLFNQQTPRVGDFDTETTGLHIINDRPFLYQFAWLRNDHQAIHSYVVDLEAHPELGRQVIHAWNRLAKRLDHYIGQNVKFDMHMQTNIGLPYLHENLTDTQFYIRFAHDALQQRKGGPPLGLKEYATAYIDRHAADHERLLDEEKSLIAKRYNVELKKCMGWTIKKIEDFFKDKVMDYTDLPYDDQLRYMQWYNALPAEIQRRVHGKVEADDIPYTMLNRDNLKRYAHMDVVLPLLIYIKLAPVVLARHNEFGLKLENSMILPFYEMERVGFKTDVLYLETTRMKMKAYIIKRREHLFELAGQRFKIGQHELIKQIMEERFNCKVASTNADELVILEGQLLLAGNNQVAVDFISTLQELRTLEKWYSTYILRFQENLRDTDRLYTTINQVGTVSLRVTSDFQQFPREGIKTIDGEELFTPRKMVLPSGGDYDSLVYIDYSQIELRIQAMYTILVGNPEPNLCKAYMPYNCRDANGELFDPRKPSDILRWRECWFEESNEYWKPVDVHAATTIYAFEIQPDDPQFKKFRSDGKTLNFMKNYGGGINAVRRKFPQYTPERWEKMNSAYYRAFPGVLQYHNYCYTLANTYSFAENLFGIRYYNVSGHDLINMLIQGTGATLLKLKIRAIYDYCKAHKIKSNMQMNIHDEISWERHKGDDYNVFLKFKQIMEDWPDTLVPIVAEMSGTRINWASKKDIKGEDDFEQEVCSCA